MVALQATNVIRAVYPARWAGLRDLRAVGAPGTPAWVFNAMGNLAACLMAMLRSGPTGRHPSAQASGLGTAA